MTHRRAKLTPFGRRILVQRIEEMGWVAARAAEALGVSRATAQKWLKRFREEGTDGLEDRTSRPRRCPKQLPAAVTSRILEARVHLKLGPHRLSFELGCPRSTVYSVLKRHGLSRLNDSDRPSGVPVRYNRERPGELLHVDIKKLGRIPDGGGHKVLGREEGMRQRRRGGRSMGSDYLHVAIDDASRVAYVEAQPDQRAETAAAVLLRAAAFFAAQGVTIERVLTDRALVYTKSRPFRCAIDDIGARHKLTRPYRPQTNGKAERFIRTLVEEWAYIRFYPDNQTRLDSLPTWVELYNQRRPHTALGGKPPMAALVNNVCGNYI
jgi:transposase InsO family protein